MLEYKVAANCLTIHSWIVVIVLVLNLLLLCYKQLPNIPTFPNWYQDLQLPSFSPLYQIQVVNQISQLEKRATIRDEISEFQYLHFILHHCRLEEECLRGKSKLKMRLKSDVNIISFNSSQFSRNSLHCHLGTNQINKQNI